jgi:hypothetical protein
MTTRKVTAIEEKVLALATKWAESISAFTDHAYSDDHQKHRDQDWCTWGKLFKKQFDARRKLEDASTRLLKQRRAKVKK